MIFIKDKSDKSLIKIIKNNIYIEDKSAPIINNGIDVSSGDIKLANSTFIDALS